MRCVDAAECRAVREGRFAAFALRERALPELCEAMVCRRTVTQEEWRCHGSGLSAQEVVDLMVLVAQSVLFALTNNVLQV